MSYIIFCLADLTCYLTTTVTMHCMQLKVSWLRMAGTTESASGTFCIVTEQNVTICAKD